MKIEHIKSHHHTVIQSYCLNVLQSYRLTVLLPLLLFSSLLLPGQSKNEEVTIIAPYIPSIGDAAKIPFRPEINPPQEETRQFEFDYVTKRVETRMELEPVEPMKYSSEKQEQFYRNYAKVGIGNYATPYVDFMASSLQSENHLIGARLKHHSSQGKIKGYPPSAYSHNLAWLYGKYFTKTHTLSADFGYDRDVVHYYGFMPDSFPEMTFTKEDIKQRFQHIYGNIGIHSSYKENDRFNHRIDFGFHYYTDYYETREAEVNFGVGFDKQFENIGRDFEHGMLFDFGLDYLGYGDTLTTYEPLFFKIKPVYRFSFAQYRFEVGLDFNMVSEKKPEETTFGVDVFPHLKAEVIIVESRVKAFAEVTGKRTINSFRSLTGTNPFLVSTPELVYTDEQIRIGGGITGNAGGMNFTADAYYSHMKDLPLFVTDTLVDFHNKFRVVYDNIDLLQVRASLGYVKTNELSARLHAAYYHYLPKNEMKAWHLPNFEIGAEAAYSFLEKYTIRGSVLMMGSRYAQTFDAGEEAAAKIKGAFDLSLGAEYQVNRMLSVFLDGNNLLNQKYQRWYNYPVQGILVMAGVKLSF